MPAQSRQPQRSTNQQAPPVGRHVDSSTPSAMGPRSVAPHSLARLLLAAPPIPGPRRDRLGYKHRTSTDITPLSSLLASKCLHISPVTVRHALPVGLPHAGGLDPLESHQDRLIDHREDQPSQHC
ncbi:hypothetical protein QBC45DRAFT_145449 [Copromyces sp. CBS 386.78]|nr:hypothetical protein QBC45DRAFT_145449 [Copromyces sp. CBS 386.78]